MSEEFTYEDVSTHTTKKDCYLVIHDKVYNSSSFVDEHPGGEEVLLDVGGQDATEAFEDVGHSDEAREILEGMKVGVLKRKEGDPIPVSHKPVVVVEPHDKKGATLGIEIYALMMLGAALAFGVWKYLQVKEPN